MLLYPSFFLRFVVGTTGVFTALAVPTPDTANQTVRERADCLADRTCESRPNHTPSLAARPFWRERQDLTLPQDSTMRACRPE